jgi:hypothetical protein
MQPPTEVFHRRAALGSSNNVWSSATSTFDIAHEVTWAPAAVLEYTVSTKNNCLQTKVSVDGNNAVILP